MNLLRQKTHFALVLTTLFVAQFFVPLALASILSNDQNIGIVICTSSGLKRFTPKGELVPNQPNEDQNSQRTVGQNDCLICLLNGLSGSADLPSLPLAKITPLRVSLLARYYSDVGFLSGSQTANFKARAPPVKN